MKLAMRKNMKSTQKSADGKTPDTVVHVFDILKQKEVVGHVTVNTNTGVYSGTLFSKKLPDFSQFAAWKSGQPLASLEAFIKSAEGARWLGATNVRA